MMTASDRAWKLIQKHGSVRKAAKAIGMDHAHLYCIYAGTKNPGPETLEKMGLLPTPFYLPREQP